jgi:D-glycero-alpha-D-manno-heptose-7-phosphate kinase
VSLEIGRLPFHVSRLPKAGSKRKMAEGISNSLMEEMYEEAKKGGATGGKISGAGGGGFMIFYCPANTKYKVIKSLERFGGYHKNYQFVEHGLTTWTI